MTVSSCVECGRSVERVHRFCPWCGTPQRRKLTAFFPGAAAAGDAERALRVSAYLSSDPERRHVRLSIWDADGVAEAAVSVGEGEAERLASFLQRARAPRRPAGVGNRLRRVVESVLERSG